MCNVYLKTVYVIQFYVLSTYTKYVICMRIKFNWYIFYNNKVNKNQLKSRDNYTDNYTEI